jgi:uncharacterized protein
VTSTGSTATLSAADARAIAIRAQGLAADAPALGDVFAAAKCLQLDTIAVVRRSHELAALARGASMADAADLLSQGSPVTTFEYPAHAACIVPLALWPALGIRRRRILAHGWRGPAVDPRAVDEVRAQLAQRGPLTISDLGGGTGSGWERSSPLRLGAEWLLWTGEAVSLYRRGWKRVYQLAADVMPAAVLAQDLDDTACLRVLVGAALEALGVATTDDVADYFRLAPAPVAAFLAELEIPRVTVERWNEPAWRSPHCSDVPSIDPQRAIPLSPFDSLVWYRPRQARLFHREYLLEAYKPPHRRAFGYFGMPVLAGDGLAGRVAPRRSGATMVIDAVEWDERYDRGLLAAAVDRIRAWAGATSVAWACVPGQR